MPDVEMSLQAELAANARIAELENERDLWRGLAESREERLDIGNDLLAAAYARADAAKQQVTELREALSNGLSIAELHELADKARRIGRTDFADFCDTAAQGLTLWRNQRRACLDAARESTDIQADPDLMAAIESSEADIAAGRVTPWEDVKKELGLDAEPEKEQTMGSDFTETMRLTADGKLSIDVNTLWRALSALQRPVPTAAEFNAAIDVVAGAPPSTDAPPAASEPYSVTTDSYSQFNGPMVYHEKSGLGICTCRDAKIAQRIADALNMQAFMATKIETLSGLLGEVLEQIDDETNYRLAERIRAELKEATGASLR